jgi:hypothetical protein
MRYLKVPVDCDAVLCGRCRFLEHLQASEGGEAVCVLFTVDSSEPNPLHQVGWGPIRLPACLAADTGVPDGDPTVG